MSHPCEIKLKSSRLMVAGLVVGHLSLCLGLLESSLPPAIVGLAMVGVAVAVFGVYRRWRRSASLRFILQANGVMQVIPAGASAFEARADQGCRDLGWAVWLAWRNSGAEGEPGGRRRRGVLMVPWDALAPDEWRGLRVWLRYRAGLADRGPPLG